MSDARQASVGEVLTAAKEGRLAQRGDANTCWFAIDGEHIALDPVNALIEHGVLCLELTVLRHRGDPVQIVLRNPCGTHMGLDWHKCNDGEWHQFTRVDGHRWAINGTIYRADF